MLLTDVQFVLVTHELHQALWLLPIPEHTALLLFHLQRPDDYIDYFCLQQGQGTSPPEIMSALRHQILVCLGQFPNLFVSGRMSGFKPGQSILPARYLC